MIVEETSREPDWGSLVGCWALGGSAKEEEGKKEDLGLSLGVAKGGHQQILGFASPFVHSTSPLLHSTIVLDSTGQPTQVLLMDGRQATSGGPTAG